MSSTMLGGKIRLVPNEEDLEKDEFEGGFPFNVPTVHLEGAFEEYYPQTSFSWSELSVVVKNKNKVIKYSEHDYRELHAEDKDGNEIWMDGRNAPYSDCWDGHYLGDVRPGHSFSTTVYDLETLTKRVTEFKPNEKEEPMTEYEIGEYADLSNPLIIDNEENIISAIKNDNEKYKDLPDNLKNDIVFNTKLVNSSYSFGFLKYVPDSVKDNEDFILNAVKKGGKNFSYFSDKVKDNYDIVNAAVSESGSSLEFASERLRDDFTIVKTAVLKNGTNIQFASSRLKGNDELIRLALLSTYYAFRYLPDNIRANREYALFAIKYNQSIYDFINMLPEPLKADKEIIIEALKHDGDLYGIDKSLENDRDIIKLMIGRRKHIFYSLPESLRNDEELARIAIAEDPSDIAKITDQNLRDKLIKEDPNLEYFVQKGKKIFGAFCY